MSAVRDYMLRKSEERRSQTNHMYIVQREDESLEVPRFRLWLSATTAETLGSKPFQDKFLTSTLFSSATGNGKLKYIAGSNVVDVFLHPSTGQVTTCVSTRSGVDHQHGVNTKIRCTGHKRHPPVSAWEAGISSTTIMSPSVSVCYRIVSARGFAPM